MGSKIGAIILAAGKSSRMKAFKPLLEIGEVSAIDKIINTIKSAELSWITCVTGFNSDKLIPLLKASNVISAYNDNYEKGMFTSIQKGVLQASKSDLGAVFLVPVDCPIIPKTVLLAMKKKYEECPDKMIVPCYRGKKGHPLLIPKRFFEEIITYQGGIGLKGITEKYEAELIKMETNLESVILDMDTPEGYREILNYYRENPIEEIKETVDYPCYFKQLLKDSGIKRLFLLRHGETKRHKDKIFLGQKDVPLSPKGRLEAEEAAEKLIALQPLTQTIYASDLKRTTETAEIVRDKLDENTKVIYNSQLREISLGSWEGKLIEEIKRDYPQEYLQRGKDMLGFKRGNNSENFYDLQYRAMKVFCELVKEHVEEDMIIVAHSGVIKIIYANLMGIPLEKVIKMPLNTGEILCCEY